MPCWGTDQSARTFFQQQCVLLSRLWTQDRWLQSVQMLKTEKHWPPITSCLATGTFAYPIYHAQRNLWIIESSSDKLKFMQISYGIDFIKNICQLWKIGKNGNLRRTKSLKKAISFGWSKTAISVRGYNNLGRVTKTIDGSDGVIRSEIVRTNDGAYKRPVVKLAPVLPAKDVFAMENRAGDIAVELNDSELKFKSASRSFQAVQFRITWQAKFNATFYQSHSDLFTLFNIYI